MAIAYIALGSNLDSEHGSSAAILHRATERLGNLGRVVGCSSLYETEPVGNLDQPAFLNAVVALETDVQPLALLRVLLAIEKEMGRDRRTGVLKGPRTLDLDLLLLGDQMVSSQELTLPHPALTQRRFVLAPLAEIAAQVKHPQTSQTMEQLLALLPIEGENGPSSVRKLGKI
jgi:2-amino-4-hydroxy-6-hydroxymethyldihydropteridine diphosphokinase